MNILDCLCFIYLILEFYSYQSKDLNGKIFSYSIIMSTRNLYLLKKLDYIYVITFIMKKTFGSFISITILLSIILLVYATLGLQILGNNLNQSTLNGQQWSFDTIYQALNSVFDIITLDDWIGVIITVAEENNKKLLYSSIAFIITLIFIGNFIILNLFSTIMLYGFEIMTEFDSDSEFISEKSSNILAKFIKAKNSCDIEEYSNDHKDSLSSSEENTKRISDNRFETMRRSICIQKKIFEEFLENSLFIFSKNRKIRKICSKIIENLLFLEMFYLTIILSAFLIIIDTFFIDNIKFNKISAILKLIYNSFFTFEVICKIISLGLIFEKTSYFRHFLNIIDFLALFGFYLSFFVSKIEFPILRVNLVY